MDEQENFEPEVVAETENFAIWRNDEDEGYVYHLELGGVTLHVKAEEWDELVLLFKSIG